MKNTIKREQSPNKFGVLPSVSILREAKNILLCILIFCAGNTLAQTYDKRGEISPEHLPKPGAHYQAEYDYDESTNIEAWKNCNGLNVAFGSTDIAYFRKEVPAEISRSIEQNAWRGERINIQVLVWSSDTLEQVRFKLSDLKTSTGNTISSENTEFRMVRYVLSNYPYGEKDSGVGESKYKTGFLMPDRFENFDRFTLPGHSVRPVWLSIQVPANAVPGHYKGIIEVKTTKLVTTLDINLNVQNQILPPPSEWKHRLDLWQNPMATAWHSSVQPWSEQHKSLLKANLKHYADAGGTFITTYAVNHTWAGGSYWPEGGMIDWMKMKDGSWNFNYTVFDTWVQLAMDCGIKKAITIYSPIPWNKYMYYDENGNQIWGDWKVDSKEFKENWDAFLTDLKRHLIQKGWFDITYIGINENELGQTLKVLDIVKKNSKDWKITYAGDWHSELDNLVDDYCVIYGKEMPVEKVEARKKRGVTTTYYVCTVPPIPNNFVFTPPIEGHWMAWYSAAHKYDGYLRWAFDAWTFDPNRDSRHTNWQGGDCFLVYPGGNSCIRLEKLRDGIVDYEKIRIIRDKVSQQNNRKANQLLKQLDEHLKVFLAERDFNESKIRIDVKKGKELLDAISEELK